MPDSTTPIPPGDGETPPMKSASVMITIKTGSQRWSPNARSDTDNVMATSNRRANEPLASSTSLRGETDTCLRGDLEAFGEFAAAGTARVSFHRTSDATCRCGNVA